MTKDRIPYEMMRRLSGHNHFYQSTISDCLESILAENRLQLSDEEKAAIVARVTEGFRVVRNERRITATWGEK